jgi:hypothetical protein
MITPAILLNIPPTLPTLPGTLFRELPNCLGRRLLLHLLISLFPATLPIIILFARLSLVPCILVRDTDFEAAYDTSEDVPINPVFVDLTGCAAHAAAPLEVRFVVECFEEGEIVKSNIPNKR